MAHQGNAILGIFLATYSSKGDYLPLRYPMTPQDIEIAEGLLKEAEARKRVAREDRGAEPDGVDDEAPVVETPAPEAEVEAEAEAEVEAEATPAAEALTTGAEAAAAAATAAAAPSAAATTDEAGAEKSARDNLSRTASCVSIGNANVSANPQSKTARPGGSDSRPDKAKDKDNDKDKGGAAACISQAIHGFDPKFLAQMFSPRPSMSDRRFQVAIDGVLFVGHPLRDDTKEKALDPDYYDAEQDDAETMSRLASLGELGEMDGWKVKSDILLHRGTHQQGSKLMADLGLINLMLNREPSEAGDSAISEGERAVRDSHEWKRRGYRKRVYPSLFHVVVMLDNTAAGVNALADRVYEHVLRRLTKALMIEQIEANYVLTQSRLIRSLNEVAAAEAYGAARYLRELLRCSTLAADLVELFNGLRRSEVVRLHVHRRIALSLHIPRGPALERAAPPAPPPRPVFWTGGYVVADGGGYALADGSAAASAAHTPRPHTPADGAPAPLATPRSVAADVQEYAEALDFGPAPTLAQAQLHTYQAHAHAHQLHTPQRLHRIGALPPPGIVAADRELGPGDHAQYPRIEAYHALLLTGDDAPALRRRLQLADASPTLLAVVDKASPTRTLAVLHRMVDCSFAQLLRVAAHLVYWGAARLVCPVSLGAT
ncbi:Nitrogen permease regulator 3, partial [Kickxella alabastrina]